jgi:hypothetical protein
MTHFVVLYCIFRLILRVEEMKTTEKVIVLKINDEEVEFSSTQQLVDLLSEVAERNPTLSVVSREKMQEEQKIVLDMQEATTVEFTGIEEVVNRFFSVMDTHPGTSIEMWNCNDELMAALQQCDPSERITRFCASTSDSAPYHFPPKEELPAVEQVPIWYDSPYFVPDAEAKHRSDNELSNK